MRSLNVFGGDPRGVRYALDRLAAATDADVDTYGEGGAVSRLEARVAGLLGKPAAVFLPSGTMAQQLTLRSWADRSGRTAVAWHPTGHLERHEEKAAEILHGLRPHVVGDDHRVLAAGDLDDIGEPLGAVVVELPHRRLGGDLPAWDDLLALADRARALGAVLHVDGARLWEACPAYGRTPAEVAAVADSVYVSFYKGLLGLGGSMVAGPEELVAAVRLWRTRFGGEPFALWPYAVLAEAGLDEVLPRMAEFAERARAVAAVVVDAVPGALAVPDPPRTPLVHLVLPGVPEALDAAKDRVRAERDLVLWGKARATGIPGLARVELHLGPASDGVSPGEAAAAVAEVVKLAAG